eukprot:Nk52_evm37s2531 gene=Nk52_evmTU37s2531
MIGQQKTKERVAFSVVPIAVLVLLHCLTAASPCYGLPSQEAKDGSSITSREYEEGTGIFAPLEWEKSNIKTKDPSRVSSSSSSQHKEASPERKAPLIGHHPLHKRDVPWCPSGPEDLVGRKGLFEKGHVCKSTLGATNVLPGQIAIGQYLVDYETGTLDSIRRGISHVYKDVHDFISQKRVPCVLGPDGMLHILDHHHLIKSLWDYFDGNPKQVVYFKIHHDWSYMKRGSEEFWKKMKEHNYVYLANMEGDESIEPSELPTHIRDLLDDPYRAIVGIAIKLNYFEIPKMPTGEEEYFFQFRWGHCIRRLGFKINGKVTMNTVWQAAAFLSDPVNSSRFESECKISPKLMSLQKIADMTVDLGKNDLF